MNKKEQIDLFNLDVSRAVRDASMDLIEGNTSKAWRDAMMGLTEEVAKIREYFTSDHVFYLASKRKMPFIHDRRAFGPIIKAAQRDGICQPTERFIPCRRKTRHAAPLRVWRSLIFVRPQ
jgi:hypothetical protein